jgi:uncharacterized membrane protein
MTNSEKCKLGFFYFDTSDKRVVVPKLSKWGGGGGLLTLGTHILMF